MVTFDESELRAAEHDGLTALGVSIPGGGQRTLELTGFRVTSDGTRFVVGDSAGADVQLAFDPASVLLFRGRVAGDAHSHAFVSVYEGAMCGRIELGSGEQFVITSRAGVVPL